VLPSQQIKVEVALATVQVFAGGAGLIWQVTGRASAGVFGVTVAPQLWVRVRSTFRLVQELLPVLTEKLGQQRVAAEVVASLQVLGA